MRALRPLSLVAQLAFFRWARHDIHPLHPDLPLVVHAVNELECELAQLLWLRHPFTLRAAVFALPRLVARALWRLA